jgi:hypothetical protein
MRRHEQQSAVCYTHFGGDVFPAWPAWFTSLAVWQSLSAVNQPSCGVPGLRLTQLYTGFVFKPFHRRFCSVHQRSTRVSTERWRS